MFEKHAGKGSSPVYVKSQLNYSGTSLLRTPLGQLKISRLVSWDPRQCPN